MGIQRTELLWTPFLTNFSRGKKKPLEGLLQGMVRKMGPGNQNGARQQGDPVVGSSGVCTTMTDDQGVPGPQGFSAALDL